MKENSIRKNALKMIDMIYNYPCTKQEILSTLNIQPATFQKHLFFIKKSGIKIRKKRGVYYIDNYKRVINYTDCETGALAYLIFLANSFLSLKRNKEVGFALKDILLLSNEKNKNTVYNKSSYFKKISSYNTYSDKISAIQEYIETETLLSVSILKEKQDIALMPLRVDWSDNGLKIIFLNKQTDKEISVPIEKINKIAPLEENKIFVHKKETVFELMGRLVKSYLLRDDERVVDFTKKTIVVASAQEDKELLFKRLLRYDVLCKVLVPKRDVEKFKDLLSLALDNLEKLENSEFLEGIK